MTDLMDDLATNDRPRRGRRRRAGVTGIVLILVGILALGWLAWQFLVSGLVAHVRYGAQISDLRTQWELGEPPPARVTPTAGQAYAILRVPSWGDDEVPVIAGITPGDLAKGVGAYPSSARPGQIGNLAVAGYRITHGAPFAKLLDLDAGAEVVIETGEAVYTYVIDVPAPEVTVGQEDAWVLDPVPGTDDAPTRPTLTLTTSQDLLPSSDRSVAFGHLASTRNK